MQLLSWLQWDIQHHVLLTGTPIQNNLGELYALLAFIDRKEFKPSRLNSFVEKYTNSSKDCKLQKHTWRQMRIYVHMSAHVHIHTCRHTYTFAHVHIHTCTHSHMQRHMYTFTHISTRAFMLVHTCFIPACIHIHKVCIHACVHTHMHTDSHTHTRTHAH